MTTDTKQNIIGFYASFNHGETEEENVQKYLWGDNGLKNRLISLKSTDYGSDFNLILFEFYVNPIPYERKNLREIENYRRKEKSIGIPVIIDNENFFYKSEKERWLFLKGELLRKLKLLDSKIKRNKLDLDLKRLTNNVEIKLNE